MVQKTWGRARGMCLFLPLRNNEGTKFRVLQLSGSGLESRSRIIWPD